MGVLVNFTGELRAWLLHNIDRGCNAADIVDSMVAQRFEPALAQALVQIFIEARAAGIEPPHEAVTLETEQPYRYESPRIAAGAMIRAGERDVRVVARVEQPIIALLDNVLSADECERLIELSRHRLLPSTVVDPASGENRRADYRDSESMFFNLEETPFIAMLDQRFSEIMNCPVDHGEGLQVLRYGPGGKSEPHFDYLIPSNNTNRESLARSGQRISTLLVYLNDSVGGETVFPEVGFAVTPRRGQALYFEYANSLRQVDQKSLHASNAVIAGEKWAVTKWMRERRFVAATDLPVVFEG